MTIVDWVGVGAVIIPAIISGYRMFALLKDIQTDQKTLKVVQVRMQCLQIMQHDPENRYAITMLYDQYKRMGGNSYLDAEFEKWTKKYNKPTKANRAKK